ncbi:hypothetical protein [Streptomyces sp. NPDC087294]|uniref:hypothetical protein n=1 Tax=Streptomyces sp. NPDC087294 TaxID=3365777 RepID=UPI00382C41D4
MVIRTLTTAAALCCAASLAAATAPASADTPTPPTSTRQAADPVLVDCLWHPEVRPTATILACGDGNSRLESMHWTRWGPSGARGEGVNVVNDCKPYCAAGTFHSYPVVVRLGNAQPWTKHPQVEHFTQLTLTYPGDRPEVGQSVMLPLWN